MTFQLLARPVAFCCLLAALASQPARAEDAATLVQKGFYLQVHEGDLAGAAAAFERVASDSTAPLALRAEAQTRLAQCREDLASADFARLMPPEAIGYVEISRPGDQIVRLAKMMGLVAAQGAAPAVAEGQPVPGIPLGPGLVFPANFTLSPALVAELKKFRGAALAITGLDERMHDVPDGVLIVHPGESDLVRGLLETAVQVIEPAKPIGNFKTYRFKQGAKQFFITVTARLLIAGTDRDAVAAVVERLGNPKAASLATRPTFRAHEADRHNRLVFAYVDGHELARRVKPLLKGGDTAMVSTLLDLDHLESLTFAAGVTDDSVQLAARVNLTPGHHNLPYNLIRTAPFTRRSLASVPRGAAGVVLLGLNPATQTPAANSTTKPSGPVEVTGMDLGREIFANVEEVAIFALPTMAEHGGPHAHMPEMAAVFAVKNAAKSEAIWNQILAIASLVGVRDTHPHDVTIDGKRGEQYQFQGLPPIVVVRAADRALIVGTVGAATAALHASGGKDSMLSDDAYRKLLAQLTPTSSKAVLVDAGRAVQLAGALQGGGNSPEIALAAVACKDLRVSLVTDEAPNCFAVNIEATGLPNVPSVIKLVASQMDSGKTAWTPKPGPKHAKPSPKHAERTDKRPTKVSH